MQKQVMDIFATFCRNPEATKIHQSINRGIEKESLRVTPLGMLAQTPHHKSLGSALTNPHITIDFSESQLEMITGVHACIDDLLQEMQEIHQFVYTSIGNEILWSASMPCVLGGDSKIPLGQFGSSNSGRLKHLYRVGLGIRYGRIMQTVSGIHFNFSMTDQFWHWNQKVCQNTQTTQEFKTNRYLDLIRNFNRNSWLLFYLFGASPAVCKTFLAGRPNKLVELDTGTMTLPYATSLRMGDLGYQSDAQSSLKLAFNSLPDYAQSLSPALIDPYPPYQALGIRENGEYLQLHTSLLQIENEFYGDIRPKQHVSSAERPLNALLKRGIEYIEVRCLDINPFLPLGIDAETIRFMDVFLLYCLLTESPLNNANDLQEQRKNRQQIIEHGRCPSLHLNHNNAKFPLAVLARPILEKCLQLAMHLDLQSDGYVQAVQAQQQKVAIVANTPAAKITAELKKQQVPFFRFAMNQSCHHKAGLKNTPLNSASLRKFQAQAKASIKKQQDLEAIDKNTSFEEFRKKYIEQTLEAISS